MNDLRDFMAFHQRVSVAIGTSLQHLADSLFVHLSNLILLRQDSYLDFVKNGVFLNLLCNAPLFGYGLFQMLLLLQQNRTYRNMKPAVSLRDPDRVLLSTLVGEAARYRPYEHRDKKASTSSDLTSQQQQPWRQFSRNRSRGRGWGANPRFSKFLQYKPYK